MRTELLEMIKPLFKSEDVLTKILCFLTYIPIRFFRGIVIKKLADFKYKTEKLTSAEKIGMLFIKSKIRNLPLLFKLPDGNSLITPIMDMASFNVLKDIYDKEIYERFYETRKDDIVLDIGAHIGVFTLKICRRIKNGIVIAIEPDQRNFSLLTRNVNLNGYLGVIQLNVALGKKDGKTILYESNIFSAASSLYMRRGKAFCSKFSQQRNVRIYRMDSLIRKLNFKKIDFLKIDAEGAELGIIKGACNCLRKQVVKNMVIACYHISKPDQRQLLKIIKSYNYKAILTSDGYIYARSPSELRSNIIR